MSKNDISYFNLSSNPIISFDLDGKLFYFRECPPILKFNEYFEKSIENFFKTLQQLHIHEEHFKQKSPIKIEFSNTVTSTFFEYLMQLSTHKSFFKTIARTDIIAQKMNFSIWEPQTYTDDFFKSYGLLNLPNDCYYIAIYFIWYMRSSSATYRIQNIARGKNYSYFSAVRTVSSKIVADSIGLSHMITSADFCLIEFDNGETLFGVISNATSGTRMVDSDIQITGSLQRELLNLNILDLICFQTDHGPNNYSYYKHNGMCTVCAFDNDNPNTFLPIPTIKHNFLGCSSLIDSTGLLNRPYVSKELLCNIQNIDMKGLKSHLKPYLNSFQIAALKYRINKLKTLIEKSVEQNQNTAISDDKWNNNTIVDEMNIKYGKTYLTIVSNMNEK